MNNHNTRQKIFDLLKRVESAIIALAPKQLVKIETPDAHILGMYWRSKSLFAGIISLLEQDLTEAALILARPLFEESLHLAQLADAGEKRTAFVLGWSNSSYEREKGIIKHAASIGLEKDAKVVLQGVEKAQRYLQDYSTRHNIGKLKKFIPEEHAAIKFNREIDYSTYLFSHQMVHGSEIAHLWSRRKHAPDTMLFFSKTSDIKLIGSTSFFAARSLIHLALSTANIFHWKETKPLEDLLIEINNFPDINN